MFQIDSEEFIRESLELHLFFGRIMKEHSIFLEVGFVAKDTSYMQQADMFKCQFAGILTEAVMLANGVVSEETLHSGEWVTDKTLPAEQITVELTGIPIESTITTEEIGLAPSMGGYAPQLEAQVADLNQRAIECTKALVNFKTNVLEGMLQCKLVTFNFPLLIIHIRREALFYIEHLERLQRHITVDFIQEAIEEEKFWNRQMAEHAEFIRHLLDPTEHALIDTAQKFDTRFIALEKKVPAAALNATTIGKLTQETITATKAFRDFKAAGTDGLLACKIQSIISPLLADHVLREANHYLRILNRAKVDLLRY